MAWALHHRGKIRGKAETTLASSPRKHLKYFYLKTRKKRMICLNTCRASKRSDYFATSEVKYQPSLVLAKYNLLSESINNIFRGQLSG